MTLSSSSTRRVQVAIDDWPRYSRKTAETLLERYGEPDEVTGERLVWHENGPWKRTILHRTGPWHEFPIPHRDYLEQHVDYEVPPDRFDELARFDGSVYPDRTRGELGASCHTESANRLSLNLAHDVITGEKTVEEARDRYAKIMARGKAGGSPEYMQGLQFEPPGGSSRDADVTYLTEALGRNVRKLGLVAALAVALYYALGRRRDRDTDRATDASDTDRVPPTRT